MSFSSSARNIALGGNNLYAECRKKDGHTYEHTHFDLNKHITNNDGHLQWINDGGNFASSSRNVCLHGAVLHAECKNKQGNFVASTLNLDEKISNKDGHLEYHCC